MNKLTKFLTAFLYQSQVPERGIIGTLLLLAASAFGQTPELRFNDQQGLAVANATITVRHTISGRKTTCRTNTTGACSIQLSNAGNYSVSALNLEGQIEIKAESQPDYLNVQLKPASLLTSITVVSASRQEELQEDSVNKVDAVNRTQMLSTGYERVSDVLQEIPGVLVRRGATSTVGGQQIQGVDSRQVLVLQDGLPIVGARGIKGGAINLNRQSSDRLTRVEVAKGSASSLYGSDAIGGVINMITREPTRPFEGGFVFSGGTLGAFDGRGDIGGRFNRGSYFINLGQNRLDSYRLIPSSPSTVGPQTGRQDILFKSRYQLLPSFSIGFTANAYRNKDQGRNLSEAGIVDGLANDSTQSYALIADWIVNSRTTLQARAYSARYDENNLTTPIANPLNSATANLNERLNRLDATISRQLASTHFIQGGVEWAQNLYRGANRMVGDNVGQQVTTADTWIQDKWTVNRLLTITAGGRHTNHSLFGNAWVPKVGLILKLNESWIVRSSFGMGFRAPDLGQLYFRFANPANFYQVLGNPNLNPENSRSFQAGTMYRHRRYRLGVTLFRNDIRDLIDTRLVGTPRSAQELNSLLITYNISPLFNPLIGRQTFINFNQARIFTQGIELDGEYVFSKNLRASGGYTFLNALDKITRLPLAQRHRHHGQTRVDYTIPKFGITTNLRGSFYSHWLLNAASGTRGLPFQIWDAYLAKSWRHGFQSFIAADNLNNSRDGKLQLATPTFDRPDYGRTFRVGLRYRFGSAD